MPLFKIPICVVTLSVQKTFMTKAPMSQMMMPVSLITTTSSKMSSKKNLCDDGSVSKNNVSAISSVYSQVSVYDEHVML
jgi:hypothetical protein